MAVACTALFVALGGTGYAATQVVTGDAARHKPKPKTTKVLTKAQVNSLIASYLAKHPPHNGANGLPGAGGLNGAPGTPGAPGSALGYARVNADGTIVTAASKNVTSANVTTSGGFVYCFSGLPFTPNSAVASPSSAAAEPDSSASAATARADSLAPCPAGTQAQVVMEKAGTGTAEPFYVVFN